MRRPSQKGGFRYLIQGDVKELEPENSIKRNLEIILNSRSPLGMDEYLDPKKILTVLDFGIPEINNIPLSSSDNVNKVCAVIKRAIESFEPRITNVSVKSGKDANGKIAIFIEAGFLQSKFSVNLIFKNALWTVELAPKLEQQPQQEKKS